jgi:hypothetical protein
MTKREELMREAEREKKLELERNKNDFIKKYGEVAWYGRKVKHKAAFKVEPEMGD